MRSRHRFYPADHSHLQSRQGEQCRHDISCTTLKMRIYNTVHLTILNDWNALLNAMLLILLKEDLKICTTRHKYFFLIYDAKINYLKNAHKKAIECFGRLTTCPFLIWDAESILNLVAIWRVVLLAMSPFLSVYTLVISF